jgi:uncharacterized integral membrane protein
MSASSGPSPVGPTPQRPPAKKQRTTGESTRLVVAVVIGGLLAAFALLNLDQVKVNWIFGTWSTPLILVIIVSFAFGAATGGVLVRRRGKPRSKPAAPRAH